MTTKRQPPGDQLPKIIIHDWDFWQTYRKDRGTPPWVKVHRCVMTCSKWAMLSDAEKGQLVSMWIVAADKDGELPADPRILKKVCQLDELPDLEKFQRLQLIDLDGRQGDAKVTPKRQPDDAPEERRGEERREEKKREELIADRVIDFLNEKAKTAFKHSTSSRKHILARLKDGATEKDCQQVITNQLQDQYFISNPKFYNPETLFRPSNFEKYLNNLPADRRTGVGRREEDQFFCIQCLFHTNCNYPGPESREACGRFKEK